MLKKIIYVIALIFIHFNSFSKSIEFDSQASSKSISSDIQVGLETDKTVFNYRDPILVKISILNVGDPVDLSIHPVKGYFNYYIEVFSKEGISIPEKDDYFAQRFNDLENIKKKNILLDKNLASQEGFKSINLMTDKMIGDQINLGEIFDLKPGYYLVRAKFYPKTIILDPLSYIYSPFVQVIVKPEQREQQRSFAIKQNWEHDKELLKTPEDSVKAFFQAKKENNWDKFFYVLDLRQLITIFAGFNESYDRGNSDQKDSVLKDFQSYLKDVNKDERILSLDIEETTIRKDQAIIKAIVQVEIENRKLSREYLFKLVHQNNWLITAYTVNIR